MSSSTTQEACDALLSWIIRGVNGANVVHVSYQA
jgi:hypothetical protein